MTTFRFPLQKALDLRRKQLDLEEARYRQRTAEVAALDQERAAVEAAGRQAEGGVRQEKMVEARDLAALDRFRLRVKSEEARLSKSRAESVRQAAEQQAAMLEARRRCRLLEKLRERRLAEWEAARDREMDEIAAESFLAGWSRNRSQ